MKVRMPPPTIPVGAYAPSTLTLYNLCMKPANQSIGRAIRYRADYAAMLMLDQRCATRTVVDRLPKWIGGRMQAPATFDAALGQLSQFFAVPR